MASLDRPQKVPPDLSWRVLLAFAEERRRQIEQWGNRGHEDLEWLAILAEEFGEAAREVTQVQVEPCPALAPPTYPDTLRKELVQVAAVCIAWLEDLDRVWAGVEQ